MEKPESTVERIGGYRVVRRLATGGTSDVLLAKAEGPHGFERTVVLKLLLSQYRDDDEFAQMFAREASAYARLSHPSIVRLFDFFALDGQLVMVLEFVDGPPLHRLRGMLRAVNHQLDDLASMHVASRIFDALAAAHAASDDAGAPSPVIHRDVNPSNVLVAWGGHVKLADFGIAKVSGLSHHSRAGLIKGTYGYMAPEQVKGEPVTPSADVYAGAVILWELLTRRRAFQRGALPEVEVLRQMAEPKITPLDVLRPDVDRNVRDALRRALEPNASRRTISADEMVGVLRNAVSTDEGREHLTRALANVRHEPKPTPSIAPSDPTPAPPRSALSSARSSSEDIVTSASRPGLLPRIGVPPRSGAPARITAPMEAVKTEPPTTRRSDTAAAADAATAPPPPMPSSFRNAVAGLDARSSIPDAPLDSMSPGRSLRDAIDEILDAIPGSPAYGGTLPPNAIRRSDGPGDMSTFPPASLSAPPAGPSPPSTTLAMATPYVPEVAPQVSTAPMLGYSTKRVVGLEAASATPSQHPPQQLPYGPPPTPQSPTESPPMPQPASPHGYGPPGAPPGGGAGALGSTAMMTNAPSHRVQPSHPPPRMQPSHPPPGPPRPHPSSLSGSYASPAPASVATPRRGRSAIAMVAVLFVALAAAAGGMAWYVRARAAARTASKVDPSASTAIASVALPSTAVVVPPSPPRPAGSVAVGASARADVLGSASAAASSAPPPSATVAASASAVPSSSPAPVGAAASGTGVLKTEGAMGGRRVFLDDRVIGQTPDTFTVKCGPHTIRIGSSGRAHPIDVPCGGEITTTQ